MTGGENRDPHPTERKTVTDRNRTPIEADPRFRCGASGPCCAECAEYVGCMADPFAGNWPGWEDPSMASLSPLQRVARRLRWLAGQLVVDHDAAKFADLADWIDQLDAADTVTLAPGRADVPMSRRAAAAMCAIMDDGPRETRFWNGVGVGLVALFVAVMVLGALRGGIL